MSEARPTRLWKPTETARPRRRTGPVVVYMPARGIGDVVWHIHAMRRIAALTPEGQVTFLTRPTTLAADLLRYDPAIASVAYTPFQGKRHKVREVRVLTEALRRLAPRAVWILDQTAQPSFAAWLAGVPERRGTGEGRLLQIAMLSPGPRLPRSDIHRLEKLDHYMDRFAAPKPDGPMLIVGDAERAEIGARFGHLPRPWVAFGMTASLPVKIWPADRFVAVAGQVTQGGTAFFVGGPKDAALTQAAADAMSACTGVAVHDLRMNQLMALFERLDLYVGNDSGPLNVAAGVGAGALGLFGGTPPLTYTPNLHCLMSADRSMAAISTGQVADRVIALLSSAPNLRPPEMSS